MAILPIHISVAETWKDITTSVALLELLEEETVEIYHDGQGLIEVIIDTLGATTINSTYNNKGRLINGSQFLQFPYTSITKFWVRRIKSELKPVSQIQLRKPVENINISGVENDPLVKSIPITETFHHLGHEGMVFIHSDRHSNITTNLDILIRIPSGDADRQVHMRFNYTANTPVGDLDVDVILYKNTIVSADGTPEPIVSTNSAEVKTSGVVLFEGSTIALGDEGTKQTQVLIAGEKKSASSKEQAVPEWILAPDGENARDYLLRATVNGGATDIVNAIFFYDTGAE